MDAPQYPAGPYTPEPNSTPDRRAEMIAAIESLPATLDALIRSLPNGMIDQLYKNWTVRQIVHHLADSHINAYVRFRLALTEDEPSIKPYSETKWSELPDAKTAEVDLSLQLLKSLHARWVLLLKSMTDKQFQQEYYHPEYKKTYTLMSVLPIYAHHGKHHCGQIEWMKANRV
jgi:uncharacterized damage-inducible protein DinB